MDEQTQSYIEEICTSVVSTIENKLNEHLSFVNSKLSDSISAIEKKLDALSTNFKATLSNTVDESITKFHDKVEEINTIIQPKIEEASKEYIKEVDTRVDYIKESVGTYLDSITIYLSDLTSVHEDISSYASNLNILHTDYISESVKLQIILESVKKTFESLDTNIIKWITEVSSKADGYIKSATSLLNASGDTAQLIRSLESLRSSLNADISNISSKIQQIKEDTSKLDELALSILSSVKFEHKIDRVIKSAESVTNTMTNLANLTEKKRL